MREPFLAAANSAEWPGYHRQNNKQGDAEPDQCFFMFLCIGAATFYHAATDMNHEPGDDHHQGVFHGKEAGGAILHHFLEIRLEHIEPGAVEIKIQSDQQLNIAADHEEEASAVVVGGIIPFGYHTRKGAEDRPQAKQQYGPAQDAMYNERIVHKRGLMQKYGKSV